MTLERRFIADLNAHPLYGWEFVGVVGVGITPPSIYRLHARRPGARSWWSLEVSLGRRPPVGPPLGTQERPMSWGEVQRVGWDRRKTCLDAFVLTWRDLQAIGGARYSGRIGELLDAGWQIEGETIPTLGEDGPGKRYRLVTRERGAPREKRVRVFLPLATAEALLALIDRQTEGQHKVAATAAILKGLGR